MSSTLIAHSPKFNSKLVTMAELQRLPFAQAIGPRHKPVQHAHLMEALHQEIDHRGYAIEREQLALAADSAAIFGVIDLVPKDGVYSLAARNKSFGFRNATDQSRGLWGVAGSRVFVCDNLSMSGELFALKRKNTTGLDLGDAVARGFDKFLQQSEALELQIEAMAARGITDGNAKQLIYDAFTAAVLPVRLLDDVHRFFFKADDTTPDTQPRTYFGLHNAFTRAMKDLTPVRAFGAGVQLGKFFNLQA